MAVYSYIFPNSESQWDIISSGSSASDPFPSKLFSTIKKNKASKLSCLALPKGPKAFLQVNKVCSVFALASSMKYKQIIPACKKPPTANFSMSRICNIQALATQFIRRATYCLNHSIPAFYRTSLHRNCSPLINISNKFNFGIQSEPCREYSGYTPGSVSKVTDCMSIDINQKFSYHYDSPPEWCPKLVKPFISTGLAGCRDPVIGKNMLQVEFGAKYAIEISCKSLNKTTVFNMQSTCLRYPWTTTNIKGGVNVLNNTNSILTYNMAKECNLFINAGVNLLEYGRFNSQVMMPVIKSYGRLSG